MRRSFSTGRRPPPTILKRSTTSATRTQCWTTPSQVSEPAADATIQSQPASQPSQKRFTVQRFIGGGDLWVTGYFLAYDVKPSYTVSITEFKGVKVRGTQYFADTFVAPAFRARWVERMDK